jgi:serine/threonine protein kinase
VSDFGLARTNSEQAELAASGHVGGTPAYMAPEQLDGAVPTEKTDQFSFCVTVWEALYGGTPVPRELARRAARCICKTARHRDPGWSSTLRARGAASGPGARSGPAVSTNWRTSSLPSGHVTRRWAIAIAAGGVAVAGLAIAAHVMSGSDAAAALCTGATERFAEVWNPRRANATRQAFAATRLSYAAGHRAASHGVLRSLRRRLERHADPSV